MSHLICVIRKIDFVKDLRGLVLNGLDFNQVRWILAGTVPDTQTMNDSYVKSTKTDVS